MLLVLFFRSFRLSLPRFVSGYKKYCQFQALHASTLQAPSTICTEIPLFGVTY